MSLINSTLPTLNLRMRDMMGNIYHSRLHSRIFDAYDVKNLVLECMSVDQQKVMVAHGGQIPSQHPIGHPLVIENWQELETHHLDTNLYQLQPRRARSYAAYQAIRAIVAMPGSPFVMEDRIDPIDYKLIFRPPDFEYRNQFNMRNPEKVGTSVQFDGLLKTELDTAVIQCYNHHVSIQQVNNMVGTVAFLRAWSGDTGETERHRELKAKWGALLSKRTHSFIVACQQASFSKEILTYAKTKNVHMFVKKPISGAAGAGSTMSGYVYTP